MTIPQILKIWTTQNATSIAIPTWITYIASNFFWLMYAIMHREKPLIMTSIAWITANGCVVAGAIIYG